VYVCLLLIHPAVRDASWSCLFIYYPIRLDNNTHFPERSIGTPVWRNLPFWCQPALYLSAGLWLKSNYYVLIETYCSTWPAIRSHVVMPSTMYLHTYKINNKNNSCLHNCLLCNTQCCINKLLKIPRRKQFSKRLPLIFIRVALLNGTLNISTHTYVCSNVRNASWFTANGTYGGRHTQPQIIEVIIARH
jgi:hypothetical protein